jgi:hypothetical protein
MLVWIPAFAAVVWLTGGTPVDVVAFATFVALIALCVTAIRAFRRRRKMMTAQQHGAAAFFGQYRRALDVEIERLRTVQTSLLLSLAIFVGYDVAQLVEREDLNHGSGLWEKLVLDLFLWWLVCGEILYRSRYVLPRLERERRDLGK